MTDTDPLPQGLRDAIEDALDVEIVSVDAVCAVIESYLQPLRPGRLKVDGNVLIEPGLFSWLPSPRKAGR